MKNVLKPIYLLCVDGTEIRGRKKEMSVKNVDMKKEGNDTIIIVLSLYICVHMLSQMNEKYSFYSFLTT
jgi:hypothetical protein